VNDEESFQVTLDADPYDQTARAAFADWLEDRGDPRAAAVRELWRMGWAPFQNGPDSWTCGNYNSPERLEGPKDTSKLPKQWWEHVKKRCAEGDGYFNLAMIVFVCQWAHWKTRRTCESAVISAYLTMKGADVPA
jgi:uncharacterized protein (TIGR02996 family)